MAKAVVFWALALPALSFSANADNPQVKAAILVHQRAQTGQTIKVVGNADELYNWDYEAAPGLTLNTGNKWILTTTLTKGRTYRYKALVVSAKTNHCNCWQSGNNREFTIPAHFTGDYLLEVVWNPSARIDVAACSVGDQSCDLGSVISTHV